MSVPKTLSKDRFLKSGFKTHNIPINYRHWQLRDMLKYENNKLIFPNGNKIVSKDIHTEEIEDVLANLYNPPTTFDINERFIACGTTRGETIVYNRLTNTKHEFVIGSTIVNSVKIKDNYLYICSNEKTLTKVDLINNSVLSVYTHNSQLNNCDITINNDYLVACGDTKDVLIFSVNGNNLNYLRTVYCVEDGGFGISWNAANTLFAVGTQDGYTCVWDNRCDNKIKVLKSHQFSQNGGAIRNLQFTRKNLADVLIWTEHTSNFVVVDTRTFKKCQIISVNDTMCERNITGLALNEINDTVFVANNDNVMEYSIDFNIRRVSSYGSFC